MLCNDEDCTGCGACVNVCPRDCIELRYNADGFLQPQICRGSCTRCGLCDRVCPVLHPLQRSNYAVPACYAAWHKNAETRYASTSGGMFSALSEHVLSVGGVVYGVTMDGEMRPYHTAASNQREVEAMRGAKYLQSNTRMIYRDVQEALVAGRHVLFSGCPCHIGGLYAFLGNCEYENLITCEIICHGVASVSVFEWYKEYLELRMGAPVVDVRFRSKKHGWTTTTMEVLLGGGRKVAIKAEHSIFMRAFYASLCVRAVCIMCSYAHLPRIGDITIGDYWGAVTGPYPRKERQRGVSLVLVSNEKASGVMLAIRDRIVCAPITIHDATAENTNITGLGRANPRRDEFLAEYMRAEVQHLMKKYFPVTFKMRISTMLGKRLTHQVKHSVKTLRNVVLLLMRRL